MLSAGVQPDNELLTRRRLLMFPHRKPDSQEARLAGSQIWRQQLSDPVDGQERIEGGHEQSRHLKKMPAWRMLRAPIPGTSVALSDKVNCFGLTQRFLVLSKGCPNDPHGNPEFGLG